MYIVSVPPLPAIADVSFTHAVAEVALGAHDEVHDSTPRVERRGAGAVRAEADVAEVRSLVGRRWTGSISPVAGIC